MGGNDQLTVDPQGGLAQSHNGPGIEVFCRGYHLLWNVDIRRPHVVDQERQCTVALHRLDNCPRPFGSVRLERIHDFRHDLLAFASIVSDQALEYETC